MLKECEENIQYLCNFKELLKKNIMSNPDERETPTKIIESLTDNMQQVKKSEYQKIKSILTKILKNSITFTERRQTVNNSIEKMNESYKKLQDQKESNRN
jgi:phage shock protein A